VHKIAPVYDSYLPDHILGMDRAELLNDRIFSGRVLAPPDWLHEAEPDGVRLPETSPAYRCRGQLKRSRNRLAVTLDLIDADRDTR
jgi:hypothetical protein